MSTRNLAARLAKVGGAPAGKGPTCRWHGAACLMGRTWPQPFEPRADDDLTEMIEASRRRSGSTPRPTRRERWAHQDHDLVPPEELARNAADTAAALARLQERNARIEARMAAGDLDYWEP